MAKNLNKLIASIVIASAAIAAQGATRDLSLTDQIAASDAICRGSAFSSHAFEKAPHSRIFTATGFSVAETFKGMFADTVSAEHRGGEFNGRGEHYCDRPVFKDNVDYLLFMSRREDGTLFCQRTIAETDPTYSATLRSLRQEAQALAGTGQDVTDQQAVMMAAMNLLPGSNGFSSRFLQGDRGEPIEYLVDMDTWPAGITSNQALAAVSNAFAAWSSATSLTFEFGGVESFGMAAPDLDLDDGRIYVQLHDNYNYINSTNTLGRGGRAYSFSATWPDGGTGARVGTNEFDRTIQGHLVMENGKASLSILSNFEEVLTHELGHVLSMDHSSEDENEPDSVLEDATMYYLAHFDGRAASLREWDTNTVIIAYPVTNTPPYGYDRIIRAFTSPEPQAPFSSGVNQAEVTGYDLQGGAVPTIVSATSTYGVFSLENSNTIFYTLGAWYGDSSEATGNSAYDRCYVRMSDGVNLSPPVQVRIIQFVSDYENPFSHPNNFNYLPNSWEDLYGVSGAANDPDSDDFTNLEEWFLNTDPGDASSNLRADISSTALSWNSRTNDLYQVQSTTNLLNGFANEGNPVLGTSTNEIMTLELGAQKFYRIQRLP